MAMSHYFRCPLDLHDQLQRRFPLSGAGIYVRQSMALVGSTVTQYDKCVCVFHPYAAVNNPHVCVVCVLF